MEVLRGRGRLESMGEIFFFLFSVYSRIFTLFFMIRVSCSSRGFLVLGSSFEGKGVGIGVVKGFFI